MIKRVVFGLAVVAVGATLWLVAIPVLQLYGETNSRLAESRRKYASGVHAHLEEMRLGLEILDQIPLFASGKNRFDAGAVLNPRLFKTTSPELMDDLDASLSRDRLAWLAELPSFDHWALERVPAIAALGDDDLLLKGRIFNVVELSKSLVRLVGLRLTTAAKTSTDEATKARAEVMALCRLLLSSENQMFALIAVKVLETYQEVAKLAAAGTLPGASVLQPLNANIPDLLNRLVMAMPSVLSEVAPPEDAEVLFRGRSGNLVDCIALAEGAAQRLLVRKVIGEELQARNEVVSRRLASPEQACRLTRLRRIWRNADYQVAGTGDAPQGIPSAAMLMPGFKAKVGWWMVSHFRLSTYD